MTIRYNRIRNLMGLYSDGQFGAGEWMAASEDNEYALWQKKLVDNAVVVGPMSGNWSAAMQPRNPGGV